MTHRYYRINLATSSVMLLFLVGCSSGGGSVTSVPTPALTETSATPNFEQERSVSSGLSTIAADEAHSLGGTGEGQVVAVIDSGVDGDHSEFTGKLHSASYDFQTQSSAIIDTMNHGTRVAGIIAGKKDGLGTHGVAYDAEILSLRILGDRSLSLQRIADTMQYASDNGANIINNSWGPASTNSTQTADSIRADYANNIVRTNRNLINNKDVVNVWAAGNDNASEVHNIAALPLYFPELQPGWVAVVALNNAGSIASFSNHCGAAADFCIAALGEKVFSPSNNNSYSNATGTSFAAPLVSGALASLKSIFPNLSHQALLERVLATANNRGIYAQSEIYGRGALDLAAASSPIGELGITTEADINAKKYQASESVLILPRSAITSLGVNSSTNVLVVDSFQNAPFLSSADQYIQTQDLSTFGVNFEQLFALSTNNTNEFSANFSANTELSLFNSASDNSIEGFGLRTQLDNANFAFGNGSGAAINRQVLGLSQQSDWLTDSSNAFMAAGYEQKLLRDNNAAVTFGVVGKNNFADEIDLSRKAIRSTTGEIDRAAIAEFRYQFGNQQINAPELSLQLTRGELGSLNKQSSFSGAFGLNNGDITSAGLGIAQTTKYGKVYGSVGYATLDSKLQNHLVSLPDSVGLTSAKIGYEHNNAANKRHYFRTDATLNLATSGDLTVKLPSSIDSSGTVGYQQFSTDVGNLYNQLSVESTYNYQLNKNIVLATQLYAQKTTNDSDYGVVFGIQIQD